MELSILVEMLERLIKIIKKAEAEGVDESVISERYIKSILETYKLYYKFEVFVIIVVLLN